MTIKDAILKSLEDIKAPTNSTEVGNDIIEKGYYDFKDAKTPLSTVSALLGDFIRTNDTRVKRFLKPSGIYYYYLTKFENEIEIDGATDEGDGSTKKGNKLKSYTERDLHKLLSTYLNSIGVLSKTIFHEESSNNKDSNHIWTHPDIVGIQLLNLQTKGSQALLKSINRLEIVKLSSYELKREINTDADLKKAFFQAVSNSSWANYGYLVAYEISNSLEDEMQRLSQSFGIGIIELNSDPFKSKQLFPSKYKDLDFKTIDKLAKNNPAFEQLLDQVEKVITASDRVFKPVKKELEEFCDTFFESELDALRYCTEKKIPLKFDIASLGDIFGSQDNGFKGLISGYLNQ